MRETRPHLRYLGKKLAHGGERATTGEGVWHGQTDGGVMLCVVGAEDAPYPMHAATLWQLLDHLTETMKAIETYAMSLPPNTRITFQSRPKEAFAASDCGFEAGTFRCMSIAVMHRDAPAIAVVDFSTGLPDGYVSFQTTLDAGRPGPITAVFS